MNLLTWLYKHNSILPRTIHVLIRADCYLNCDEGNGTVHHREIKMGYEHFHQPDKIDEAEEHTTVMLFLSPWSWQQDALRRLCNGDTGT